MARTCEECGKKMIEGYTNDWGENYICEDCMEKLVEEGRLIKLPDGEEDECGGFYLNADGTPTGLYFTDWDDGWEDDEEEDDDTYITETD